MIDFNKLRILTPEERREANEQDRQRAIDQDTAQRRERSRKRVTITLISDAECRFTMGGTKLVAFRGEQPGGKPIRADWYAPYHMEQDEFTRLYNQYLEGSAWQLAGYWKPFKDNSGKTHFTFVAQFVELLAAA